MKPQQSLLSKRTRYANRDGQFNRFSDLLHKKDKRHEAVTSEFFLAGVDTPPETCYNYKNVKRGDYS